MAITFSVSRFHPWISLGLLLGSSVGLSQEWIVKFRAPSYAKAVPALKNMGDFSFKATHPTGRLALIDIDPSAVNKDSVIDRLLHRSDVEYMVPNIRVHAFEDFEGDTQRSKQWALLKVQAQEAWKLQAGSRKVTVAVIDTGVDWKHGDLKDRIWSNNKEAPNGVDDDKNGYIDDIRGWNFFGKNNNPMDETSDKNPGHGTHCAGIIGAEGQGSGTIGIAPNISIMPIRFLGADGSGDLYSAALAIDYATQNGADVISASWGAAVERSQMQPVLEAIERASTKGIVFVAAAANDGKSNDTREVYPANAGFPNMISVAASDSQDQKPKWSNYGAATVDLASPGADIIDQPSQGTRRYLSCGRLQSHSPSFWRCSPN
jgi:thermitase